MDVWIKHLETWLENEITLCEERRDALKAEAREDEAVFEKIRANVYGIFRTILFATRRMGEEDAHARRFYQEKLDQIPAR